MTIRDVFLRQTLERRTSLAEGALSVEQKSRLTTNVDPMGFATLVRRDAAFRAKKRLLVSCDDEKVSFSR